MRAAAFSAKVGYASCPSTPARGLAAAVASREQADIVHGHLVENPRGDVEQVLDAEMVEVGRDAQRPSRARSSASSKRTRSTAVRRR